MRRLSLNPERARRALRQLPALRIDFQLPAKASARTPHATTLAMAGLSAVDRDRAAIERSGHLGPMLAGVSLPTDNNSRRLSEAGALARYSGCCNCLACQQGDYQRWPVTHELGKIPFRFEPSNR